MSAAALAVAADTAAQRVAAGLTRADALAVGGGRVDLYAWADSASRGVGVEAMQRMTSWLSAYGEAHVGTVDGRSGWGASAGIGAHW